MFDRLEKFSFSPVPVTGVVHNRARFRFEGRFLLTLAVLLGPANGCDGDGDPAMEEGATNQDDDAGADDHGSSGDDHGDSAGNDGSEEDEGDTAGDSTGDESEGDGSTADSGEDDSTGESEGEESEGDGSEGDSGDSGGESGESDSGADSGTDDSGGESDAGDSEGDSGDDGTGPVDGDDFCDVLSEIMCQADQDCCTNTGWQYDNVQDCLADQVPQCETDLQALIDDPRTAYDPDRARQTLNELQADTESCDLGISQWFISRSDGLLSVFAGTVSMGGDCSPADADDGGAILSCTGGNACRVTPLPLSGTCGMHKTANQQCVTHFECQEILWCTAPEGGIGQCQARKANSESCTETVECESLQCESGSCVEATVDLVYCANR